MKKAFTIIELLVVLGILGILMAVLLGTFSGSTESARSAKCEANMRNLAMAVQSYGMEHSYYPLAGSVDRWSGKGSSRKRAHAAGWISWGSRGTSGSYISPYAPEVDKREYSITNGVLWKAMKGARDSYVCPSHIRACQDRKSGMQLPLWSYVMSANFGWAYRSEPFSSQHLAPQKYYRSPGQYNKNTSDNRTERYLLFAELPFANAKSKSGNVIQSGDMAVNEGKENDPILQYEGCNGGGDECIGFNHKSGKETFAHVCFADGHVEKLLMPKNFDAAQAKELTSWLCCPVDDYGAGKPFDVLFNGRQYVKDRTSGE